MSYIPASAISTYLGTPTKLTTGVTAGTYSVSGSGLIMVHTRYRNMNHRKISLVVDGVTIYSDPNDYDVAKNMVSTNLSTANYGVTFAATTPLTLTPLSIPFKTGFSVTIEGGDLDTGENVITLYELYS